MKMLRALSACALLVVCSQAFGGVEQPSVTTVTEELNPQRFEFALESGYLFGAINPPADYQILAEFLTARIRWGVVQHGWLRGYNQFYFSAVAEPILRGIENHYFGFNFGMRYQTGSLFLRRCRRRRDRQPPGNSRRPGSGFYVQHFIGCRHLLQRQ